MSADTETMRDVYQRARAWAESWWPLWPNQPRDDGTTHLKAGRVAYDHRKHWTKQKRGGKRGLVVSVGLERGYGSVRFGGKWCGWPRVEWVPRCGSASGTDASKDFGRVS